MRGAATAALLVVLALQGGCKREHARWSEGSAASGELAPAEALDPERYALEVPDVYRYVAAKGRGTNLFRMRSGRRLSVQAVARPAPDNGDAGDQLTLWDVTNPAGGIRGLSLDWQQDGAGYEVPPGSGQRYSVRWETRPGGRVVRVEGGGSWFEVTEAYLLAARTAEAAREHLQVYAMPGVRRLPTPVGFEYYRSASWEADALGALRPAWVVRAFERGEPLRGELPLGDSGFVLAYDPTSGWVERQRVRVAAPEAGRGGRSHEELFRALLPTCVTLRSGQSIGSGAWVSPDGLVVTNAHVVVDDAVRVLLPDGRDLPGQVVARDDGRDLALVRVPGVAGARVVEFEPRPPEVGTAIIFIGAPAGQAWSLGSGQVAAVRRFGDRELLQLQAPINPGNSGGPVFDLAGRLVGVVVSRREETPDGRIVESMGYAIPMRFVLAFVQRHAAAR
ncbi:MAG: serine protease [Planctomycetes bacterium]|nr:serine protease [Planctomycetota bacterium]